MDCASNKERVFYVVKGDNDNYIENIDGDFKITITKNPHKALHMWYGDILPNLRTIESVNYCRINLRSIEDAEIKYASVES